MRQQYLSQPQEIQEDSLDGGGGAVGMSRLHVEGLGGVTVEAERRARGEAESEKVRDLGAHCGKGRWQAARNEPGVFSRDYPGYGQRLDQ